MPAAVTDTESVAVSVVVPIFNERDNLAPLVQELETVLDSLGRTYEILAIDDGSTDGSREQLRELAATRPRLKVVFFRRNSGQTAAFDAGFRYASGDVVITMDADLQNDPADIPKLLAKLEEGFDLVTGWRRKRKDNLLRTLPSRIANWIIRKITGAPVHDVGCSLKVCRKEITDELNLYGEMHRFIVPLADGIGARIAELEVNHRRRSAGRSKYGLGRTFKVLLDLLTVWFVRGYQTKPIYLFGGFGLALLAGGVLSAMVVLWQKFATDVWVHKNPLFLVAILLTLVGMQLLGTGLIAEVIARTYFESSGKRAYSIAETIGLTER